MNNEQRIQQLDNKVRSLETFKSEIGGRQLNYPVDTVSKSVLYENVVTRADVDVSPYSLATYDESTSILLNNKKFLLDTTQVYTQY